ncbi:hypothetical protein P886_1966 [Alteromonadaceae bacterium 2753L.S.0a.02]|nr:hypothetical protein P886_1966 [Alteromonadaceae bacterium 2753L.S.0a.02]
MVKNIIIGLLSLVVVLLVSAHFLGTYTSSQYDASELFKLVEDGKLVEGYGVFNLPLVKPKKFLTVGKEGTLSVYVHEDMELGLYVSGEIVHSAYLREGYAQKWLFLNSEKLLESER